MPVDPTLRGEDVALEELEKGGLTRAVGADDGDARVHVQPKV